MKHIEYAIKGLRAPFFKLLHPRKEKFVCPICQYRGPFKNKKHGYGPYENRKGRINAKCPRCGELERARLQFLVLEKILETRDCSQQSILHIAPENAFRRIFKRKFKEYVSGDLYRKDVDFNFDIQDIPFPDESFDMLFASHVLQYPDDDIKAISEFRRVLKPDGVAVLPVPLVHERTVDKKERQKHSIMMHEPGLDYFERFERFFSKVDLHKAEMYPKQYQLFMCRGDHNKHYPLSIGGGWYSDIVPVCYA